MRLLGYVDDVASVYAASDVFLLTSANEGTPVVAIEALAAGVPVVATEAGGTRSVVDDGETGLLAPVGDVETLAAVVIEGADHHDAWQAAHRRSRFSRRGRRPKKVRSEYLVK